MNNKAIIEEVGRLFGVTLDMICSKSRKRTTATARAVVCYILHRQMGVSSTKVARTLTCTHATILYHCRMVETWMQNPRYNAEAVSAVQKVRNNHDL